MDKESLRNPFIGLKPDEQGPTPYSSMEELGRITSANFVNAPDTEQVQTTPSWDHCYPDHQTDWQ